ncbi:alkylhydroperoxidase [Streptomyces sp. CS113]|uniref:carboxymuconolactone decarboxylase family protein n=1 Tax=Streptomyces sp. CS113 TaxID=1982761 RepID=UPI000B407C93|nr:carboxymuconolactone decarboxylase family protein [Streptomyces sp. CS113]OWA08965.1 alkylhydroperoxidase [Streptomyces sp. CS113]
MTTTEATATKADPTIAEDTTTTAGPDGTRSRLPDPTGLYPELTALSAAVQKALRDGPVPQATLALMRLRTAQVIGSTYHGVAATDALRKAGEEERRITAVATWQSAPCFSGPERAALELAEAVLTPNPFGDRVSDDLFARLSGYYDTDEIWHLTLYLGHVSLFTPVALVGKPVPGRPPGKNYTA